MRDKNQTRGEEALDLDYDLFGYDKRVEARANEFTKGGSPDYVYRETKRSVDRAVSRVRRDDRAELACGWTCGA